MMNTEHNCNITQEKLLNQNYTNCPKCNKIWNDHKTEAEAAERETKAKAEAAEREAKAKIEAATAEANLLTLKSQYEIKAQGWFYSCVLYNSIHKSCFRFRVYELSENCSAHTRNSISSDGIKYSQENNQSLFRI